MSAKGQDGVRFHSCFLTLASTGRRGIVITILPTTGKNTITSTHGSPDLDKLSD